VNKEESIFKEDIKKRKPEEREVLRKEKKEEPAFKKEREPESPSVQTEVKVNTPASNPQPVPPDNRMREVVNRFEEKKEKEPIIQGMNISLQSDSTLTFEKENSSVGLNQPKLSHGNPLPKTDSFDVQKNIARLPSNSEGDIPPKAVKVVNPIYPQWAKDRKYQGEVILRVQLLSDGRVGEIKVKKSSGHEILDRSAITAVKQWEFIPGREGNTPIWYWVNIPVKFQLQ
jgi:protein TonB